MGTSHTHKTLAQILFSDTRCTVLTVLFGHPEQSFYLRQIIRMTGAGQGAVQRELDLLTGAGIISRSKVGNQVFFQANQHCPVYSELRGLIMKTTGLADILTTALQPIAASIRVAFVFGSIAEGRETPASDVDVMVIGNVSFGEVVQAIYSTQEILGREINPSVVPEHEFQVKAAVKNTFIYRILSGNKIFLIGGPDELDGLAQKPLGH